MNDLDETVEIPSVPRPTILLWLGVVGAGGTVSWLVTVAAILATEPTSWELQVAGLCFSVAVSVSAGLVWNRYCIAKAVSDNQRHLSNQRAGHHAMLVAEIRSLRCAIEQVAGQVSAEQQAAGAKLTKIIDEMPRFWHGLAEGVQVGAGIDGNVLTMDRYRGPSH